MTSPARGGTFRSLGNRNFRLWVGANIISNTGTWMQGTAQTWLVLTQLTHHSAGAVGIVTALQFIPQVLLVTVTGSLADHIDRRKLLIAIQCGMGALALILGIDVVSGLAQLWHVYILAFFLGCGMAFDSPARHSFVSELVSEDAIGNAVAINSTAFQLSRTMGPALAGLLIALVGTGWVFIFNGLSFGTTLIALTRMNVTDLHRQHESDGPRQMRLLDGFRYLRNRPDLVSLMVMLFFLGMLGMNFGVFVSVMSVAVFHKGASDYGLLTSVMAIGSVLGALLAARRDRPRLYHIIGGAFCFGCVMILAALAPSFLLFGAALLVVGLFMQTVNTSGNGFVQLSTDRSMRGRVMAIYLAVMLGGLPIGAPAMGWVADHWGPRIAMIIGGSSGFIAALIGLGYLVRVRGLRLLWEQGRPRIDIRPDPYRPRTMS
ncbi:MFS transporter [Sphingobium nicotianae]|uniref:MFS transporter n=1 Tax=Sphingobium nicotianae TaxID=2782607 RepID=A0A9X1DET2_9SPHN|nr:MFS transporter [Sphingobium nicotianae]MBT2188882.1 MFS transporter [Sphingobium nicotianae]